MTIQNKAVIAISAAAMMFAGAVQADDINSVVSIEQANESVSATNDYNARANIQDYVDAANADKAAVSTPMVDTRSRWEAEQSI